jgi:hypothetical protein
VKKIQSFGSLGGGFVTYRLLELVCRYIEVREDRILSFARIKTRRDGLRRDSPPFDDRISE